MAGRRSKPATRRAKREPARVALGTHCPTSEPVRLLVADAEGRIYDHPELLLAGERGAGPEAIGSREWLPLPRGSDLFALPGRAPIGLARGGRRAGRVDAGSAARRAPSPRSSRRRTPRVTTPAGERARARRTLPTFAYAAVGFADGALLDQRVPRRPRPAPGSVALLAARVRKGIDARRAELPRNRVARQLEKCALELRLPRRAELLPRPPRGAAAGRAARATRSASAASRSSPTAPFRASHDRLAMPPTRRGARRRRALAPRARAGRRGELRAGLRGRAAAVRGAR